MNALLEDNTDYVESLFDLPGEEPDSSTDSERRLQVVEHLLREYHRRLDEEVLPTVQCLEDLLNLQMVSTRKEIAQEASERREQIASLAKKLSRHLDQVHVAPNSRGAEH